MGQGVPRILDDCILVDGAADPRRTGWGPRPRWLAAPPSAGLGISQLTHVATNDGPHSGFPYVDKHFDSLFPCFVL